MVIFHLFFFPFLSPPPPVRFNVCLELSPTRLSSPVKNKNSIVFVSDFYYGVLDDFVRRVILPEIYELTLFLFHRTMMYVVPASRELDGVGIMT